MKGLIVSLSLASLVLVAQAAPQVSVRLTGTVVDAVTGRPLEHALIRVRTTRTSPVGFLSGRDGRFRLDGPADSVLVASRSGYAEGVAAGAPDLTIKLQPEAVVSGVIADRNGAPMRWAPVRLDRVPAPDAGATASTPPTGITDERGVYRVGGIAPGNYALAVRDPIDNTPRTPPRVFQWFYATSPLTLSAGQERAGVNAQLSTDAGPAATGAAISGTITDDAGIPVAGANIQIFPAPPMDGEHVMWFGSPFTDSRGVFRIWGVAPGRYNVLAMWKPNVDVLMRDDHGRDQTIAPAQVYCPGSETVSAARELVLTNEREITTVDIRMPFVETAPVTVNVVPTSAVLSGAKVVLIQDPNGGAIPAALGQADATQFTFPNVRVGSYRVVAFVYVSLPPRPISQAERTMQWGTTTLQVVAGATNASTVVVDWGVSVAGRLAAADGSALREHGVLSLTPRGPAGALGHYAAAQSWGFAGGGASLFVRANTGDAADGQFVMASVPPGSYAVEWSGPPGWRIATATLNGQDILRTPFTVRPHEDIRGIVVTVTNR